jgi:hypothetical protein
MAGDLAVGDTAADTDDHDSKTGWLVVGKVKRV